MTMTLDGTSGLTSPAAVLTTTPLAVTSGGTGVTTSTGSGANVLGTSPTLTTPTFDSASLVTISGTAPLYMCRAWVNFNGTGTVAIRGSGNVSSITDGGVGVYTVNFTTAIHDANYSAVASGSDLSFGTVVVPKDYAASNIAIITLAVSPTGVGDAANVNVSIFR